MHSCQFSMSDGRPLISENRMRYWFSVIATKQHCQPKRFQDGWSRGSDFENCLRRSFEMPSPHTVRVWGSFRCRTDNPELCEPSFQLDHSAKPGTLKNVRRAEWARYSLSRENLLADIAEAGFLVVSHSTTPLPRKEGRERPARASRARTRHRAVLYWPRSMEPPMIADIALHREELAQIVRRFGVRRLEVFGSAAREADFDAARSDIDFLVEFGARG